VASIADCSKFTPPAGTRRLCQRRESRDEPPIFYVWAHKSPAGEAFNGPYSKGSSELLHRFAVATIAARPAAYAALVGRDLLRYVDPRAQTPGGSDAAIALPSRPRSWFPFIEMNLARKYFPDYRPHVRAPATLARAYTSSFHFPRPLLVLLLLAPIGLAIARTRGRVPMPRNGAEVLLTTGCGLALLVGATATSAFVVRYLVPTIPLFLLGAALAVTDLRPWRPLVSAAASSARAGTWFRRPS
jgi:hypothetical protein